MARAMASPLRVKNTAYLDIAATPPPTHLGILRRPLAGGDAPRTRPTSEPSRYGLPNRFDNVSRWVYPYLPETALHVTSRRPPSNPRQHLSPARLCGEERS
jgi:hypothetical protein